MRPTAAMLSLGLTVTAAAVPSVVPDLDILDDGGATGDRFGTSIARGAAFTAFGSPEADTPSLSGGRVRVRHPLWIGDEDDPWQAEGAVWETLEHATAAQGALFGQSLAASEQTLAVGAPGWRLTEDISSKVGAVLIYEVTESPIGTASLQHTSSPDGLDQYDEFGRSVSLETDSEGGHWLAVGAPGRDNDTGAVWILRQESPADLWEVQTTLQPAASMAGDRFGDAVSMHNGLLVVGAPGSNGGLGAAHLYQRAPSSDAWTSITAFVSDDPALQGAFGEAVSVDDDDIVVGGPEGSGHASHWRFISTAGIVVEEALLEPDDWSGIEGWGRSVSVAAPRLVVGATPDTSGAGAAALFRQIATLDFELVAMLGESDWGFDARHGTCVLVDDDRAWVGAPRAHVDGVGAGAVGRWDVLRTPGCPGDLDYDFDADQDDLMAMLGAWGNGDEADLTGDAQSSVHDLLIILERWGPCN